ncbi:hypothetical protein Tco_0307933 [Tanacetum coccineum]
MDSMIPTGQKNTLVEYMILSGFDNCPSMLDKDLTKKYVELSPAENIQVDCDMKAINIILQGLPTEIYSLVNHHRVTKDLWEKVQLLMQVNQQTHLAEFPQIDSCLPVPVFKQGDDPINVINKMMSFLSTVVTSYFPTTNNQQRNSSNPRQQATILDERVTVQPVQGDKLHLLLVTSQDILNLKRKRDTTWFRDKVLLVEAQGNGKVLNEEELEFLADTGVAEGPVTHTVITHNAVYQVDDLDAYDSDCDNFSTSKAVLMANLSSYGSDVLFEVPHSENNHTDMLNQSMQEMSYYEQTHLVNYPENKITSDSNIIPYSQYLLVTQNAAIQDTNSFTQQDAMILSVFEQLSNQFVDFEKEINYLKQTLSEQLKENELLTETFNVLKKESKEKENKNIDKEIALEKKVKELDNIVYKMALGFQNPFYLKKAQQIRPRLYDGSVMAKETNVISIADSEETLMLEKESRSKMILKQSDPIVFDA